MRKQLLFTAFSALVFTAMAGENNVKQFKRNAVLNAIIKSPVKMPSTVKQTSAQRGSRALDKFELSTAGNLLSVLNSNCNQLYIDDSINTVIFIHRNDQTALCCNQPGSNVAQYRYDVSKNGGTTWTTNIGPVNPTADNVNINGRFPQAVIYRTPGNLIADSAYMVYSGTWHDGANGSWEGEYRGAGRLDGNVSTFRESNDIVNGGIVGVAGGFTQGKPGTFINVNTSSNTTFASMSSTTQGLLIQKGTWNNATRKADWTLIDKQMTLDVVDNTNGTFSAIAAPVAAFDPTGQYGWVAVDCDNSIDGQYTFRPVLYKSDDFGVTWNGPLEIVLDSLPGMFTSPEIADPNTGAPLSTLKTIVGGLDIVVDYQGNPHIAAVVGIGQASESTYSFFPNAGMAMYNISYTPSGQCGDWTATFIAQVFSVSGSYTSDALGDNNRVQSARSADGKNVFVFWADTDEAIASQQSGQETNVSPNLFGVGIDLAGGKMTAVKNFTEGDPEFGGETATAPSGTFFGALFPVVSQNAFKRAGSHNVPVILTEPDYNNPPGSKSSENPAKFYYCKNIDFAAAEYTLSLDNAPPVITINGDDTVVVLKDQTYTDLGATAFDCVDGVVTVFTSSNVLTSVPGYYEVAYYATDAAGNSDTVRRTVLVATAPLAIIGYTKLSGNRYNFRDESLYIPTSRTWNFGDQTGSTLANVSKTYQAAGNVNVCLTVSNAYGSDDTCLALEIFLGIDDLALSNAISVFPTNGKGDLTINLNNQFKGDVAVSIYDLKGQKVSSDIVIKAGQNNTQVDYTSLASGAYKLRIGNKETGYAVKPILINK